MSKSYRIRTTPGEDNGYLRVNVDLNQNYDFLELLSLKILQTDTYQNFCSEYGVVAGRVIINNGFGVPNVKVSIFVPVEDADLENPVISELYPYRQPFPDDKNGRGIRYNLLPSTQQSFDHTPVGTFPKKRQVLDDNTYLEIYEKYYKYTTTTNEAGDYILFGIPVGRQILHYDMDVSDIGFLSARPYELISQGFSEDEFENRFKFKSSNNLDSLPQIITDNKSVDVQPYWCDSLSTGSQLGINRLDISIDDIQLVPTAIFTGSIISDDENDFLSKECDVSRRMGLMSEVVTGAGTIEAIRRTVDGDIKTFNFNDNSIDENGNWSVLVPMNLRKVVTDEFGNLVPSPDGIKGVATEGDYRFRISMDSISTDVKDTQRAKYLVPNTNNNFNFGEYGGGDLINSSDFTINRDLSKITENTPYENDLRNQYNYLEEFFPFRWKKVYTVKQYIGRFQKVRSDQARSFIGIKDIYNSEGVNKFPYNRIDTRFNLLYAIICIIVTYFGHAVGIINGIFNLFNGLITVICNIKFPIGICNPPADPNSSCCQNGWNILGTCYCLDYRCLFSDLLCKSCTPICNSDGDEPFSCSGFNDDDFCGDAGPNCCAKCCGKIPLIPLRCAEEDKEFIVTLIFTPFAPNRCNKPFVLPFSCLNCGGLQTPAIKDWVSCLLEPVAVYLKMLKFDFYNDWVGGSLYFPLVKRLYKLKKEGRRFGQLRRDKFCDYDCRVIQKEDPLNVLGIFSTILTGGLILLFDVDSIYNFENDFQDENGFKQWRVFLNNSNSSVNFEFQGCRAVINPNVTTEWYGSSQNDLETDNLDMAVKELLFKGKNSDDETCYVKFDNYSDFEQLMINQNIQYSSEERILKNVHSKPNYIEIKDGNGNNKWKNVGGHGHHTNFCRNTRMVEKTEYFKKTLDCLDNPSNRFGGKNGVGPIDNLIGDNQGNVKKPEPNDSDIPSAFNTNAYLDNCDNSFCLNPSNVSYISGGTEEYNYGLQFSSTMTLSFWVYTNGLTNSENIIASKYETAIIGARGWKLSIRDNGNINFTFQGGGGAGAYISVETENIPTSLFINNWVNIVLTYDGSVGSGTKVVANDGIKIFINGVEINDTDSSFSPSNNVSTSSSTHFIMGNHDSSSYYTIGSSKNFNGIILSGKRWGTVLTTPSIEQIFDNGPEINNVTNGIFDTDILFDYYMCDATINGTNYEIIDRKDPLLTYRTVNVVTGTTISDCLGIQVNLADYILDPNCGGDCEPSCGSNGVAPCVNTNDGDIRLIGLFGENAPQEYKDYVNEKTHGLISWYDKEIYYTPYIPDGRTFNGLEYKSNLMLPTTIMELGSTTYCDIDDIPFIMDKLKPTTFQISTEDVKYLINSPSQPVEVSDNAGNTITKVIKTINKFTPKDGSLNLRAYVELSCFSTVCMNTIASVNSSQIGVNLIDKNDLGIEIGNCFVRFNHDDEIRSYFCRRFNGYKADLSFKHNVPSSILYDNRYNTYPEIKLKDAGNSVLTYVIDDLEVVSTYNDDDFFIPGDACGYEEDTKTDYFYGVAAGQTSNFINYPNVNNQTIDFGQNAQPNGVDVISDQNNGSDEVFGIKFNRSQTPYYMYFGLVPGKTALHKTVSKFFADRINAVTLQGIGGTDGQVDQNINNTPNINNEEINNFSVFKTCLGETLINTVTVGSVTNNTGSNTGDPGDGTPSNTVINLDLNSGEDYTIINLFDGYYTTLQGTITITTGLPGSITIETTSGDFNTSDSNCDITDPDTGLGYEFEINNNSVIQKVVPPNTFDIETIPINSSTFTYKLFVGISCLLHNNNNNQVIIRVS